MHNKVFTTKCGIKGDSFPTFPIVFLVVSTPTDHLKRIAEADPQGVVTRPAVAASSIIASAVYYVAAHKSLR